MASVTAQPIQEAARTFLNGGRAQEIWSLAHQNDLNKKALVASAGVVDKLVDLVLQDELSGESRWAFFSLYHVVTIGQEAQNAIAHAHDGAIFAWLAGPRFYDESRWKAELITNFTKNHPANALVLDATRSGNPASLVESVLKSLKSGDIASAALAMNLLVGGKGVASTFPDSTIAILASVSGWDSTNSDSQLSTIRAQAESLLVQFLHVEEARQALARSQLSVADNLKALCGKTSDGRDKLLAVLRLNHLVKQNTSSAQEIVSQGGIAAVAAAVQDPSVGILPQKAALLLGTLAQECASVRDVIVKEDGVASLVLLSRSTTPAQKSAALDALRIFLHDESSAQKIASKYGITFLCELLLYTKHHPTEKEICFVDILRAVFDGDDELATECDLSEAAECAEMIAFLVELMNKSSADTDETYKMAEALRGLVQVLLPRLNEPAEDRANHLKMLEYLSRIPANQSLFKERKGVRRLVALLKTSSSPETLSIAARILANIACKNQDMSMLIVECEAAERLFRMMKSSDVKVQTAALMALRNLANCDANRDRIGTPALVVRLVNMITVGKTMKQKVTAAGVLGSLARLPINKQRIIHHDGDTHLVDLLGEVQTPSQVETVAAALWVLTNDEVTIDRLRQGQGKAVLQTAIERMQPHPVHWASRMLLRLT